MCNTLNIKALELYCNIKKWNIELDTLIKNSTCDYSLDNPNVAAKQLSDAVLETNIDRSVIENLLKIIYDNIKDTIYDDALIIQGKKGFIDATKTKITSILLKQKLYKEVKDSYNEILEMLYINLILYKESI